MATRLFLRSEGNNSPDLQTFRGGPRPSFVGSFIKPKVTRVLHRGSPENPRRRPARRPQDFGGRSGNGQRCHWTPTTGPLCRLGGRFRQSAYRTRYGQQDLATCFRIGSRSDRRRLRSGRGLAHAPSVTRLAGCRIRSTFPSRGNSLVDEGIHSYAGY